MKLYVLRPIILSNAQLDYWDIWDSAKGFVVRARNKKEARSLASFRAGDEGKRSWIDSKITSCEELSIDGEPKIIMRDFQHG